MPGKYQGERPVDFGQPVRERRRFFTYLFDGENVREAIRDYGLFENRSVVETTAGETRPYRIVEVTLEVGEVVVPKPTSEVKFTY